VDEAMVEVDAKAKEKMSKSSSLKTSLPKYSGWML